MPALFRHGPLRLAAGLAVLLVLLLPGGARADEIDDLRTRAASLQAEEESVLLALYSLESRLTEAHDRVARVRLRLAGIESDQDRAQAHLGIARRTLHAAESHLAGSLRGLYQQGDAIEPLTVLLGSASLTEVVDGLESLTRAAEQHRHIAAEARKARQRVRRIARDLRERARETRELETEAAAAAESLAAAQAERASYLGRVRTERLVTGEQLVIAESEARAAEARAREVAATRAAAASFASIVSPPPPAETAPEPEPASDPEADPEADPGTAPEDSETPAEPEVEEPAAPAPQAPSASGRTLTVTATAYSGGGLTATGIPVGWGVVAVDPSVIPLGTRMTIPGYGEGVAADTGGAVGGLMIDVWMPTEEDALTWGVRTITITIH